MTSLEPSPRSSGWRDAPGLPHQALDPANGYLNLGIRGRIEGSWRAVSIHRSAVNRNGTQLAAVGNVTTVAGRTRHRAFVADLGTTATINPWYYVPLTRPCASTSSQRQAYLSDVDYAPDGSYFVVSSTGSVPRLAAEIGETVCDAVARFDIDVPATERPVWINYTGGDTVWSVAATGAAVYAKATSSTWTTPTATTAQALGPCDV